MDIFILSLRLQINSLFNKLSLKSHEMRFDETGVLTATEGAIEQIEEKVVIWKQITNHEIRYIFNCNLNCSPCWCTKKKETREEEKIQRQPLNRTQNND